MPVDAAASDPREPREDAVAPPTDPLADELLQHFALAVLEARESEQRALGLSPRRSALEAADL
jgi:hypothetical protein